MPENSDKKWTPVVEYDGWPNGLKIGSDGRILVAGGTEEYDKVIVNNQMQDSGHGFKGTREAIVFDEYFDRAS